VAVSAAERRYILDNLTRLAAADINNLWRIAQLQSDLEFAAYITQAFPEIVDPYHQLAAEAGATFFEEDFPAITTAAIQAPSLPADQLTKSVQWALGADGDQAIERMVGTAQRAIYDGERDTTVANASSNGLRWVRVARPNACAFCRLLASRTATDTTYSGAGVRAKIDPTTGAPYPDGRQTTVVFGRRRGGSKQTVGNEYHDYCQCTAKAIPAGVDPMDYLSATEPQFAELAQQWDEQYQKARADAGTGDTKLILSKWRAQEGVEVYTPKPKAPKFDRKLLDNATSIEEAANYISGKHGIKVDQLISSPMVNGVPIETSVARGVDILSAARAAKPHYIDARTAREFGQAVDDTLDKYSFLTLDEIKADFYPAGSPVSSMAHASPKVGREKGNGARYVAVNQFADAEGEVQGSAYVRYRKAVALDSFDSRYKAAIEERPVYAVMIHEMGHVVDFNSGGRAQVDAFQAIRDRVLQTPEAVALREKVFAEKPGAMERLYGNRLELTPEFEDLEKQWHRDNLVSSYSFKDDSRDAGVYWTEALAEAFADVELRGDKAEEASKIIHKAMVDAARKHKAAK
jgi:hypothetical protein